MNIAFSNGIVISCGQFAHKAQFPVVKGLEIAKIWTTADELFHFHILLSVQFWC